MTWRRNLRYSHSASQALLWPESFSSDFTFTATIYLLYSVVVGHVRKRTSRPWRLSSLDHHQAVNTISTDQFVDSSHTLARTIHKLNTIRPPRNAFPTPFHVTTLAEGALINSGTFSTHYLQSVPLRSPWACIPSCPGDVHSLL